MSTNRDNQLDVDRLLTTAEAADLLSISPRTLWTLRNSGEIDFVRVRKNIRFQRSVILRFIEDNTTNRPQD